MEKSRVEALVRLIALIAVAVLLIFAAAGLASSVEPLPFWSSQQSAAVAATCAKVYACNQESVAADGDILNQPGCQQPGFDYLVREKGGKIGVTAIAQYPTCNFIMRESQTAALSARLAVEPEIKDCSQGQPVEGYIPPGYSPRCSVKYCYILDFKGADGNTYAKEECKVVGEGAGDFTIGDLRNAMRTETIPELAAKLSSEELGQIPSKLESLNISSAEQKIWDSAFDGEKTQTRKQIAENENKIEDLGACSQPGCYTQIAELQKQNSQLKERLIYLDKEKVTLKPPPGDGDKDLPGEKPPGQQPPGGGGPTFPQPTQQKPGSGSSGLAQFLQGFMKSLLGSGAPPPGNQTPQPPGTCSQKTHCAEGKLYSRNTQCVDTLIQQCQYGCEGNACASAPKETGRPTAELSCQPEVADPGMELVITWGCSEGTSVGSGFDTGGALSGATSTILVAPPLGTNIISFGLTCSNKGLTASASCKVQVAKPAIVLVANPKSVESGTTSQIGWVTSGMKECVVSSPDQSDFTARNAGRTNVSGVAETSPVTASAEFLLTCTTFGGNTRDATTTVSVL